MHTIEIQEYARKLVDAHGAQAIVDVLQLVVESDLPA